MNHFTKLIENTLDELKTIRTLMYTNLLKQDAYLGQVEHMILTLQKGEKTHRERRGSK